jgi:transposase
MHPDKTEAEFIVLRSEGWSISRIAKHLDVSRPTLIKWNEQYHFAIRSLRAVELEALHQSILEKHEQELAHLAKQQSAIAKELSKRKLADVSTEILFRIDSLLREEIQKTRAAALLIQEDSTYIPQPEHPMQRYLAHADSAQAKTNGAASALPRADNDDSNSNEKSDLSNSPDPENPQSQPVNPEPSRSNV